MWGENYRDVEVVVACVWSDIDVKLCVPKASIETSFLVEEKEVYNSSVSLKNVAFSLFCIFLYTGCSIKARRKRRK